MSGHSKWSKIKRQKKAEDIKRGKVFSKLTRAITVAIREGEGLADPDKNVKLRLAIDRAKDYNMPKENIEKAIRRATSEDEKDFKEVVYEGYGPGGVALMIEAATDNPNRSSAEIKHILEKKGGKMGGTNSVAYLFDRCGMVVFDKRKASEDKVFQFAEEIEAKDIEEDKEDLFVYIPFEKLGRAAESLNGLEPESTEVYYRPLSTISIKEENIAKKVLDLIESLEELDDVQKVYANFDIPDKFLPSG